jgi:hypothetical protein
MNQDDAMSFEKLALPIEDRGDKLRRVAPTSTTHGSLEIQPTLDDAPNSVDHSALASDPRIRLRQRSTVSETSHTKESHTPTQGPSGPSHTGHTSIQRLSGPSHTGHTSIQRPSGPSQRCHSLTTSTSGNYNVVVL